MSRILLLLLLLCHIGCGGSNSVDLGPTGRISGSILLDGYPLPIDSQVVFVEPAKGYTVTGYTDTDGKFAATSWNGGDMPIGTYKVMVQPPAPRELTPEEELEFTGDGAELDFPEKYTDIQTSRISYTVQEGSNEFNIELTSK